MQITEHAPNSHTFKLSLKDYADKEAPLLMISDVHFDSPYCQRDLLKKHMDEIKAKNGHIFIYGDWFDVMGCHRDPRSKMQDVRPEYIAKDRSYLDLVVEDSYNFLLPYKDNLAILTYGNHETSIMKHRDTDILNTLVFLLRQAGSNVVKGGYSGFINLQLMFAKDSWHSYIVAYHHGGGGNAPRSKGILHADLDIKNYPDADIFFSGHNHQKGYWPIVCYRRAKTTGLIKYQTKYWVKTGTYKRKENRPLMGGWEDEKKFDPTPLGGYYLNLKIFNKLENGIKHKQVIDTLIDAK